MGTVETLDTIRNDFLVSDAERSRCILFAAYFPNNSVTIEDEFYIQKLSQHGDVFVFVNSDYLVGEELLKLQAFAKTVTVFKHNQFDFGSWKYLIRQIGSKSILEYGEIVFANNSTFLINKLSPIFDDFSKSNALFYAPYLIDEHYIGNVLAISQYKKIFSILDQSAMYSSYFMIMSITLFKEDFVQKLFFSVIEGNDRLDICYKFERELTRKLIRHQIVCHTWTDYVYRNSFMYTHVGLNMARQGFPFLKKKAISQEYYEIDHLESRLRGILRFIPTEYAENLKSALRIIGIYLTDELHTTGVDFFQLFDPKYYLEKNSDVEAANIDPFEHFMEYGWKESREFSPWFSLKKVLLNYPDISKEKFLEFLNYLESFLFLDFDYVYYYNSYPDVQSKECSPLELFKHYIRYGSSEGRNPCNWFNTNDYLSAHKNLAVSSFNPFFHFIQCSSKYDRNYFRDQRNLALQYKKAKHIVIIFNVARDLICGGMLSCNRILKNLLDYYKSDPEVKVAMSGVPITNNAVHYSKFESFLSQIQFNILIDLADPDDVHLMLPEVFAIEFFDQLQTKEREWLNSRGSVRITLMNQNQDLCPSPDELTARCLRLTNDISISTAHQAYTTQELSNKYGFPVSLLTPVLPTIRIGAFQDKRKVIMLSPDEIHHSSSNVKRKDIIEKLMLKLPDYMFITVEDLTLHDYLALSSSVLFSLTFGEGMDGYFIEPVLSGGISFAVYNPIFFPPSFLEVPTVFMNWEALLSGIETMIRNFESDTDFYTMTSSIIRQKIQSIYSDFKSYTDLAMLLNKKYSYFPKHIVSNSLCSSGQPGSYSYNNTRLTSDLYLAQHTDGFCFMNFGHDFEQSLYDCFVLGLFDVELKPDENYLLIDVGFDYGLFSIYQQKIHPNIKKIFGYEPIAEIHELAQQNLGLNRLSSGLVDLKNICLDNVYGTCASLFFKSFGTLSSVLQEGMPSVYDDLNSNVYFSPVLSKEVELVEAGPELLMSIESASKYKKILKIDSCQHLEIILNNLEANNLLIQFETIFLVLRYAKPELYISMLQQYGFVCTAKKNNIGNVFYLVATKRDAA